MDTTSGLAFHVVSRITGLGAPLVIAAIVVMAAAVIAAMAIVGLLQPEPEVILVAPIRWNG